MFLELFHFSSGAIMSEILGRISPSEYSPYVLRCVSRAFERFYSHRGIWIVLLNMLSSDGDQQHPVGTMKMEQVRRQCALVMQQASEGWMPAKTLQAFRKSGWTALRIRNEEKVMPLSFLCEFTTSLVKLSLSGCSDLKSLPTGVSPKSSPLTVKPFSCLKPDQHSLKGSETWHPWRTSTCRTALTWSVCLRASAASATSRS